MTEQVERNQAIRTLRTQGKTLQELAGMFDLSRERVRVICAGVIPAKRKVKGYDTILQLAQEGKSRREISRLTGRCLVTIQKVLGKRTETTKTV